MRRHDDSGQLSLDSLWWGYRPHWADDKAPQPINATVEKVATSPYFRGVAKAIHPRMPLILDHQSLEPWLDPDLTGRETIRHLVHHLPHDRLIHWPVSTRGNRPVEDDPSLIEAVR